MGEQLCIVEEKGNIGILSLDRPKALNAIDVLLQQQILVQLQQWEKNEDIKGVVIKSSQERAFCAGADIRQIAGYVRDGDYEKALSIFQHNYDLDYYVSQYGKPVFVLMDGITMGGGVGLGAFASYRVVTERSVLAMPEVMIGLTPDAGSNLIFQKSSGFMGLRAMLTGQRFDGKMAIQMGFADYMVDSSLIEHLLIQLEQGDWKQILLPFKRHDRFDSDILWQISSVYDASSVEEIIERLAQSPYVWARTDLVAMKKACPFSLRVTYKAWHLKIRDLKSILERDLALVGHLIRRPDFLEGVRSVLIDKDRAPCWDRFSMLTSDVDRCFTSFV